MRKYDGGNQIFPPDLTAAVPLLIASSAEDIDGRDPEEVVQFTRYMKCCRSDDQKIKRIMTLSHCKGL